MLVLKFAKKGLTIRDGEMVSQQTFFGVLKEKSLM